MKQTAVSFFILFIPFFSSAAIGPITCIDSPICAYGLTRVYLYTFADTTAGGIWTTSDTSIAGIDSGSGELIGITAGVVTITYSVGADHAIRTVTVAPIPKPITAIGDICIGDTVALKDSTPGGYWNWDPDIFLPGDGYIWDSTFHATNSGYVYIHYTINGCEVSATIHIGSPPPITGSISIGIDSTTTLSNALSGGRWYSSNPGIAAIDSVTGFITGIAAGYTTISYVKSCTRTIGFTVHETVGITNSTFLENTIQLSPNPVQSQLTITSSSVVTTVSVINIVGQQISFYTVNSRTIVLNLSGLPHGTYLLRINGAEVRRIEKQ